VVLALVVVLVVVLRGRGDDPSSTPTPTGPVASSKVPDLPKSKQRPPKVPPVVTKTPKPLPAKFRDEVALDNGVAIEVTDIESVKGQARGAGQVAGPALRFTIQVDNRSKKTINLDLAVVTAYSGSRDDPAIDLSGPGASPLPQSLKAGAKASGKYVFAIPVKERGRIRVDFSYTIDESKVIFRGPGT
jgi:hypothetical protein